MATPSATISSSLSSLSSSTDLEVSSSLSSSISDSSFINKHPLQTRQQTQLDLKETWKLCVWYFWCGVKDAFDWPRSLIIIYGSNTIRQRAIKCFLLNGVIFLGSIFFFNHVALPILHFIMGKSFRFPKHENGHNEMSMLDSLVIVAYQLLWVYPIFLLSFVLNAMWYQQIANRAYTIKTDKPAKIQLTYDRFLKIMADEIYRAVLFLNYLGIATVIYVIPHVGPVISFVCFCWIYAFYSFEYKWIIQGWSLKERLDFFEERWAYFAGFGFFFTLVTFFVNQFLSAGIFAMTFPVYIIMANNALPMPSKSERAKFSTYVPYRLPIFWLPMKLNNRIISFLPRRRKKETSRKLSSENSEDRTELLVGNHSTK